MMYQSCNQMSVKICNDWQVALQLLYIWTHASARDWPAIKIEIKSNIFIAIQIMYMCDKIEPRTQQYPWK